MKSFKPCSILLVCLTLLLGGCSSNSSDNNALALAGNANGSGEETAPTYSIDLAGGQGSGGAGGRGGLCQLTPYSDVSIKNSGTVDASFEIPKANIDLGERAFTITPTTVVKVDAVPGEVIPKGTYYIPKGGYQIYISDGDADIAEEGEVYATGLKIEAGAKLEFNYEVQLQFEKGAVIEGTIKTNGFKFELMSWNESIAVGPQGQIDTRGPGAGGRIQLTAYGTPGVSAPLQMLGSLNTSGASGETGSDAGQILVSTGVSPIYLAGSITANGGHGTTYQGGMAGQITINASRAPVMNKAAISASGGDGATHGGGCPDMFIEGGSQSTGTIINAGQLTLNGGSGTKGPGANGGAIFLKTYGGEIKSSGAISARGGASTSGAGGQGGYLTLVLFQDYAFTPTKAPGSVSLSGNIALGGGQGVSGGAGGEIKITTPPMKTPMPAGSIELLGYSTVNLKGGQGAPGGGGGSFIAFTQELGASGAILNQADVDARGGNGLDAGANGGPGGWAQLNTHSMNASASLINTGDITIDGGSGASGGTCDNELLMRGWGIVSTGALSASGGAATSGQAGNARLVHFVNSAAATVITGKVYAKGGAASGTAKAGNAAPIRVEGKTVKITGTLDASGGLAATKAYCGKGGQIEMNCTIPPKPETRNTPDYLSATLLTVLNGDGSWSNAEPGGDPNNYIVANGMPIAENTGKLPK